ncbi:C-terminal binding protein [Nocardia sp. CA-120079]|uniref:C-terminal binding protein n=1 Tax=Nocardia sp. CA-120079 TaxID=3239974 RepID=UPI003D9859E1
MSIFPPVVLLTDRAWPDDLVEREIIEGAGFTFVSGPADPAPAAVIEKLVREHQPTAILTCWAPVSATAIGAAPELRVVARMGVGLDNIDVTAATDRGVLVTNVPDFCVAEVSDHAVGMILAWTRGLVTANSAVRAGRWQPAGARLRRIGALTCGIVGYGRIGRETARKLAAFGTRILATDPHPPAAPDPAEFVDLDSLLASSDVVVVHAPLTPETRGLIGAPQLARMRPGGLLVNVSRGGLVDTTAVIDALATGHLGGAALDVLDTEPDVPADLLAQEGALITPHVAFTSELALLDLRRGAAEEVVRVLTGQPARHPRNTVSVAG